MARFVPAALLSLLLWAVVIWTVQMGFTTVGQYFDSVGALLSLVFVH